MSPPRPRPPMPSPKQKTVDNAQVWLVFCPGWYTPIMVALMLVLAVSQLLEPKEGGGS